MVNDEIPGIFAKRAARYEHFACVSHSVWQAGKLLQQNRTLKFRHAVVPAQSVNAHTGLPISRPPQM